MAGRRSQSRALSYGRTANASPWTLPTRGQTELIYDLSWIQSDEGRPLLLFLPLSPDGAALRGEIVLNYFDNLLPDSESVRRRIAQRFQTDSIDAFDLLQAIGRDCVGAVQLLDEDEVPSTCTRSRRRRSMKAT